MRRSDSRQHMTVLVRRWRKSTDTQAEFAARHGLSRAKLRYWLRRVVPVTSEPLAFTPVQIVPSARGEPGAIDVVLTSGERLVVHHVASAELIRTVVTALRSPC